MGIVQFNSRFAAAIGVLAGAGMAVGLPAIILIYGQHLGVAVQTTLIIIAILAGGLVIGISAFMGIVIPAKVSDGPEGMGDMTKFIPKKVSVKNGHTEVEFGNFRPESPKDEDASGA